MMDAEGGDRVRAMARLLDRRRVIRDALERGTFDVVVIGGGIIGLSTAWQAARSGLRASSILRLP